MTHYQAPDRDRRGRPRFAVKAPATIVMRSGEIPAFTRDLSNRGVYLYVESGRCPKVGEAFEIVIELPAEVTLSERCRIRCLGRAIRVESTSWDECGIAAEVLQYTIPNDNTPYPAPVVKN